VLGHREEILFLIRLRLLVVVPLGQMGQYRIWPVVTEGQVVGLVHLVTLLLEPHMVQVILLLQAHLKETMVAMAIPAHPIKVGAGEEWAALVVDMEPLLTGVIHQTFQVLTQLIVLLAVDRAAQRMVRLEG
jgi:hypothetical protein